MPEARLSKPKFLNDSSRAGAFLAASGAMAATQPGEVLWLQCFADLLSVPDNARVFAPDEAVTTYVPQSWGSCGGRVSVSEMTDRRDCLSERP